LAGRFGQRRACFLDGSHASVSFVPVVPDAERVEHLQGRRGDLGADAVTMDQRGFPDRHGRPGVRLFTARVSAVQASAPSPRAMVRHPILPMRESIMTTENSAVAPVDPSVGCRKTRPAGTRTYRPPTNPISVRS